MALIDALQWRYATKEFDTTKKLSDAQLATITDALRLSASSFGLQPWKFVVVTDPALRAALRPHAWDQAQITDASHLIVITVPKDIDEAFIDRYVQSVADTRGMSVEDLAGYAQMMKGALLGRTPEARAEWAARQAYIALGTGLAAAADAQIDACPMEGFSPEKFDEILGLDALGLTSVVLMPVGFRAETDKTAAYKKVRFSADEVVIVK